MREFLASLLAIAVALSCCASLRAEDRADAIPEAQEITLQIRVEVDSDGHGALLEPRVIRDAAIRQRVAAMISSWQFEPATLGGKPTWSRTGVNLVIRAAMQSDGSLALRVASARVAPLGVFNAPEYPGSLPISDFRGSVVLDATITTAGSVRDVTVVKDETDAPESLVMSAIRAVRDGRFQPDEVGGKRRATRIRVPFVFVRTDGESTQRAAQAALQPLDADRARLITNVADVPL